MRRIITTTVASSLLALALPAAASAHHAGRHEAAHHAGAHHRRHHHRAHTVVFSPAAAPTATPSPATPGSQPGEGETAGTIASFEGGVLKITLADGTTVSGKVTETTEIQCGCPGHDGGQGDDQGPGGFQHDDHGDFHGDDENVDGGQGSCGVSSLVAGATVTEAELSIGGAGAVWEKVELAQQH